MIDAADSAALLSVEEARERILAGVAALPAAPTPLLDALGLVLASDVSADTNIPPFRNSAMDGYAVRATDLRGATGDRPAVLQVIAEGPAGYAPRATVTPGTAIRIMTGAPLPDGADTVVRFEETGEAREQGQRGTGRATIAIHVDQPAGINVREAGEDIRHGQLVLRAGTVLRPVEIGVLASLNYALAPVHRRPVVAIIATGDEVVDLGPDLQAGQIRNSNSYALAALVRRYGGVPRLLGVTRDDAAALEQTLQQASQADLIVSSGGVSVGDYDFVKDVLRMVGRIDLWQVRMKPGKPLAYGWLAGRPLLGLPGNPVAAFVSFEIFGRPLLLRLLGHPTWRKPTVRARLSEPVENRGGRQHYVRAVVQRAGAEFVVCPTGEQGSGVLTALLRANSLLVIPEGVTALRAGDEADVELLHAEQGADLCDQP